MDLRHHTHVVFDVTLQFLEDLNQLQPFSTNDIYAIAALRILMAQKIELADCFRQSVLQLFERGSLTISWDFQGFLVALCSHSGRILVQLVEASLFKLQLPGGRLNLIVHS
eukprot:Skav217031  [mRNA]  locus=scaffold1803:385998:387157:+ [translate_table: standard]